MVTQIKPRIETRSAPIAIFGMGYVGLPLAALFVRAGFQVIGFDLNQTYLEHLKAGVSSVLDVPSSELAACLATGRLQLTSAWRDLRRGEVHIICVPTPLSKSRQPDMSYIQSALEILLKVWRKDRMAVLESTTYPGTTDEVILTALSRDGLVLDQDFLLAFSPERVEPGNKRFPLRRIPKVVGGMSEASAAAAASLYGAIFEKVHLVGHPRVAELAKLLENTFRNVNIALVNEFSQICDTLGVNIWEVIEAAATKPFGFMPFYPGPGIGGHCIPLDPQYLVYKSRLHGYEPRLVALADQINQEMPTHVIRKAMDMLNNRGLALNGAHILAMGVAYKPDLPDLRESPALLILEGLIEKGAEVVYADPWIPAVRLEGGQELQAVEYSAAAVAQADLVVILTAHKGFDYALLQDCPDKVLDTRNARKTSAQRMAPSPGS